MVCLGGDPKADSLDAAFSRQSQAGSLAKRPHHVVVILGENYALWPLLPEYRSLGLAQTGEWLEKEGAYTYHFLSNGNGTMTSLNGFLTGLPDVGLYVNYTMGLKGKASPFAIGETMKRLGYRTVFWYGGLRSWQDLEHFTLREGFDEFHCADELPEQGESSSWGAPDGALFDVIRERMQKESEDTFYFILTTSNHPLFAYDVDAKGFPRVEVTEKLPPSIPRDKATIDQLGHIWYADQVMGKFIREVKKDDPSTLFVVTGDHAERFNFAADVSLWAQSGVPCYFYGDGVPKDLLQGAGGQSSPDRTDAGRTHRAAGHDVYVAPASFDAVEAGFQSSALHRKWRNWGGEGAVECGIQEGDRGGADGGTLDGTAGSVRRCFLCEC